MFFPLSSALPAIQREDAKAVFPFSAPLKSRSGTVIELLASLIILSIPLTGRDGQARLPAGVLLNVVILGDGQADSSAQAAAFQYRSSVRGRHALSKAMNAHTAADLWLIGPLRTHR